MSPAELQELAQECLQHAYRRLAPLGRPDIQEDILDTRIDFRCDRRVAAYGWCYDMGANHHGKIEIFIASDRTAESYRKTLLHEISHQVVHWMRPGIKQPNHANGLFSYVFGLLGYYVTDEECRQMDRRR